MAKKEPGGRKAAAKRTRGGAKPEGVTVVASFGLSGFSKLSKAERTALAQDLDKSVKKAIKNHLPELTNELTRRSPDLSRVRLLGTTKKPAMTKKPSITKKP